MKIGFFGSEILEETNLVSGKYEATLLRGSKSIVANIGSSLMLIDHKKEDIHEEASSKLDG